MKGEPSLDPAKLTFSQAYGYEELPRPLKLGEMDPESRVKLWNQFYGHLVSIVDHTDIFLKKRLQFVKYFVFYIRISLCFP